MKKHLFFLFASVVAFQLNGQNIYFGADLSYVNEMEDCGVTYSENKIDRDVYSIFKDHGANLVRLRLWHTPKWYDGLNNGKRYSDLADLQKSIARAKEKQMEILLDFHLSDNWADPSKQLVPEAWLPVVDNVELLKDSLYNYIYKTLTILHAANLLPEMVQLGNETNKGILLSPEDNKVYTLDWERNSALFNEGIRAVRDFETENNEEIEIVIHMAGPADSEWLMDEFITNGVTDFDVIGVSYYWAWHMPQSIGDMGNVIRNFKNIYSDKKVIIVETGYLWTNQWNDDANNIITQTHPDYQPVTPENQKRWLIDLTKEVISAQGDGIIYWEPAWVSSSCFTQWGQGSHQEHATFFNFENDLIIPGGIEWMEYEYGIGTQTKNIFTQEKNRIQILVQGYSGKFKVKQPDDKLMPLTITVVDSAGKVISVDQSSFAKISFELANILPGIYFITVHSEEKILSIKKMIYQEN